MLEPFLGTTSSTSLYLLIQRFRFRQRGLESYATGHILGFHRKLVTIVCDPQPYFRTCGAHMRCNDTHPRQFETLNLERPHNRLDI
jgi:hypothetical protein